MSQHDCNIANDTAVNVRGDFNLALVALDTTQAGATAPSTTRAYQTWYDTATGVIKIRNAANSAWLDTGIRLDADRTRDGEIIFNDGLELGDSVTFEDATEQNTAANMVTAQQTEQTGVLSTTSTSFTDMLTVSITPTNTASKILLMWDLNLCPVYGYIQLRLRRNTTSIHVGSGGTYQMTQGLYPLADALSMIPVSGSYIDSPSLVSAITYRIQWLSLSGSTVYLNQNSTGTWRAASGFRAIELPPSSI